MEITTVLNEIDQVLAVLVLCLDIGMDGFGVVKDAIGAGEGAALVQRDGDAGINLDWRSRGKYSERNRSEQGGHAEHGIAAGSGSERK